MASGSRRTFVYGSGYNGAVPSVRAYDTASTTGAQPDFKKSRDTFRLRILSRSAVVYVLAVVVVFFSLHFLHLRADFPNFSPWSDWAKYTDEGWYGDAAIRHYLLGTWRLPGDFNPAAALPVWPLLEAVLFRFTGVGIVAARMLTVVVFGGILLSSFFLLRGGVGRSVLDKPLPWSGLSAAMALLLMAVSPYFYVFSRMAVLEPLLVLLTLIALLLARGTAWRGTRWQAVVLQIALGIVMALMIGTKTTAISLLPAVLYMLASACGWRTRTTARAFAVAIGTTVALCSVYYVLLVRPKYLEDFHYLFSANRYTGITAANARDIVSAAFQDVTWMGSGIAAMLVASFAFAIVRRRVWKDPLVPVLSLWIAGYFAFLIYHANLQPRYYLVIAVPITLLVLRLVNHAVAWRWQTSLVVAPALLVLVAVDARQMLHYVRHPEYTFQRAADQIEQVVESDPKHSHTVLSISGSDLTLMTGLPSICDDFGTMELEDRIAAYKPGWFVAWNYVEDDKMEALGQFYKLTRVREIPAMDDPDRNLLIVYRLDPKESVKPRKGRRRRT